LRDAVARGGGGGVAVSFDAAAAAEAWCKSRELEGNGAGAERVAAAPCEGHIHPSIHAEIPQKPIVLGEFTLYFIDFISFHEFCRLNLGFYLCF
jgi:hypothetical protein